MWSEGRFVVLNILETAAFLHVAHLYMNLYEEMRIENTPIPIPARFYDHKVIPSIPGRKTHLTCDDVSHVISWWPKMQEYTWLLFFFGRSSDSVAGLKRGFFALFCIDSFMSAARGLSWHSWTQMMWRTSRRGAHSLSKTWDIFGWWAGKSQPLGYQRIPKNFHDCLWLLAIFRDTTNTTRGWTSPKCLGFDSWLCVNVCHRC